MGYKKQNRMALRNQKFEVPKESPVKESQKSTPIKQSNALVWIKDHETNKTGIVYKGSNEKGDLGLGATQDLRQFRRKTILGAIGFLPTPQVQTLN